MCVRVFVCMYVSMYVRMYVCMVFRNILRCGALDESSCINGRVKLMANVGIYA